MRSSTVFLVFLFVKLNYMQTRLVRLGSLFLLTFFTMMMFVEDHCFPIMNIHGRINPSTGAPHYVFCSPIHSLHPPATLHYSSTRTVSVFSLCSPHLFSLPHFSPGFSTTYILSRVSKKNKFPKFMALRDRFITKSLRFLIMSFYSTMFIWFSVERSRADTDATDVLSQVKYACVKISLLLDKVCRKSRTTKILCLVASTQCLFFHKLCVRM
jgi:hypothetical protein